MPPNKNRKILLGAALTAWILTLSYNGLVVAVALYAEWAAPMLVQDSRRPAVEKEFFVRHHRLGWMLQPNLVYDLIDSASQRRVPYFTTGADGLRTTRRDSAARPEIILLGDSFVQGYYLYESESIPARLQARTGMATLNAGVGGYSTDQQFLLLQQLLQAHDPAWVALVFFANDLLYLKSDMAWEMEKPRFEVIDGLIDIANPRLPPAMRGDSLRSATADRTMTDCCVYDFFDGVLGKISKTYAALPSPGGTFAQLQKQIALTKDNEYEYQIRNPTYYTRPELYGPEWSLFFQLLVHMSALGDREGFRLVVLYLPEIAQIAQPHVDHFAPQRYFTDRCAALRIDCIAPHRAFVERQSQIDLYFMDDGHLSPAGADLVAEILQERIAGR